MKKISNIINIANKYLFTVMLVIMSLGLLYFIGHLLDILGVFTYIWHNAIQLASFFMMGVCAGLIGMLFIPGERADESAYEVALSDMREKVKQSENNFDLIKQANENITAEKDRYQKNYDLLAVKYVNLRDEHNKILEEVKHLRVDQEKQKNLSVLKVNKDGKLG